MNKEEEEGEDYLNHDIVTYDGDCEEFAESLNHRYEEGDLKVAQPYIWHGHMDAPTIYKMGEDHEWVPWNQPAHWSYYMTRKATSLKIFIDLDYIPPFINEDTDYIMPRINTALLARSRTAKLRVKRVKPAYVERGGREDP